MKRLIMICVMSVVPILQISTLYGQLELGEMSVPVDQLKSDSDSNKDHENESVDSEIEDAHERNLDTIDVNGSGNWLEKRIWYEKAQAAFDDILVLVNRVVDMRTQFLNEVNAIGHKIDAFYVTIDFAFSTTDDSGKVQLNDKFKAILADLEFEQKLKGDLSEKERQLQLLIKQELSSIDQLEKNIKLIGDVDGKIEQTLMQAFKTIDECRDYESKAWATFKDIGKEIDDKKARNLYYEMRNFHENIDQKSNYLSSSLLPYLHNILVAKIESIIGIINQSVEQLKQKGIEFSEIMKSEQEHDLTELKEREKEALVIEVAKGVEAELEKEDEARAQRALARKKEQEASWSYTLYGYYNQVLSGCSYVGHQVMLYAGSAISYLYHAGESIGSWSMSFLKSTPAVKKEPVEHVASTELANISINSELPAPTADHEIDTNVVVATGEQVGHTDTTAQPVVEPTIQV